MFQSRTHNCNELRIANAGENVKLVGWMENVREVGKNFADVYKRQSLQDIFRKLHTILAIIIVQIAH